MLLTAIVLAVAAVALCAGIDKAYARRTGSTPVYAELTTVAFWAQVADDFGLRHATPAPAGRRVRA